MKEILNSKTFKKVFTGILPIVILLVALVPGSLWGTNYVKASGDGELPGDTDDSKAWIYVLNSTSGNTLTALTRSNRTMVYETSADCKDHTGNGAAKGSITYQGEDGEKPKIILSGVDLRTSVGFLVLNGASENDLDDYEVQLYGDNVITSTGESAIRIKDSKVRFHGSGTLTINQMGGNPAINASTTDSDIIIEDETSEVNDGTTTITITQSGTASPALVSVGSLEVNKSNLSITQETVADAIDVSGDIIINPGKVNITNNPSYNGWKDQWWKVLTKKSGNSEEFTAKAEEVISKLKGKSYGYIKLSKTEASGDNNQGGGSTGDNPGGNGTTNNPGGSGTTGGNTGGSGTANNPGGSGTTGGNPGGNGTTNNPGGSGAAGDKNSSKKGEVNSKSDGLPKTGDSTIMMPYILLLIAGVFVVILFGKKSILEK